MKFYRTQNGATLIIILIIVLAIMGITAIGLEMSLLEFKSTTRSLNTTVDFYNAENCLNQAAQKIYSATEPLTHSSTCLRSQSCAHDYILRDYRSLNFNWWDTHGYRCVKNIFSYTELLTENTSDDYTFYRITVYYHPYGLLQMTIGKSAQHPVIKSWQSASLN